MSVGNTQKVIRNVVTKEGLSGEFPAYFREHQFAVTFYSDEFITPVTPSAGTVTIKVSDDGFNYGDITNGTVDATTPTYDRPNLTGYVKRVSATPDGIAGATHYQITVTSWR